MMLTLFARLTFPVSVTVLVFTSPFSVVAPAPVVVEARLASGWLAPTAGNDTAPAPAVSTRSLVGAALASSGELAMVMLPLAAEGSTVTLAALIMGVAA